MISILSILVHNATHIDAPRHMIEQGEPIDRMPLSQVVIEAVLANLPDEGANSTISAKDILATRAEFAPGIAPVTSKEVPAIATDIFPEKCIGHAAIASVTAASRARARES